MSAAQEITRQPSGALTPDSTMIADFLRDYLGDSIHLVAILPDAQRNDPGGVIGRHFSDHVEAAAKWAADRNCEGMGVYWSVNYVAPGLHKKAKGGGRDMAAMGNMVGHRFLHVDIDAPKKGGNFDLAATEKALAGLQHPPSFTIWTGGGIGAFWRLDEAVRDKRAVTLANLGLECILGGDHCHNHDRVMRLPGTVNWPNAIKRARGRVPALATIQSPDDGVVYPMHGLAGYAAAGEAARAEKGAIERVPIESGDDCPLLTADDLALHRFHPLRSLIERPTGGDRSNDALACAGRMNREGYSPDQILGVLLNPANPVAAHCLDHRDPRYAALRCIEKTAVDTESTASDKGQAVMASFAADTFPLADLALWSNVEPTPKPFVMPGFVPARELTLATGAGGANKSTFGQQLATCVAAGVPMLGLDVMAGKALYITAEDDDDRLHWMQAHVCRALGVRMADLAGRLHLASLRGRLGNELATFDHEGKLRPAPSFQLLKATIEATGAELVVLDNAAHLFAGNENDRQQVTAFVNLLYSLCRDLGVTVILVAHSNKAGDSYSGSTAWLNAVRSQIVLSRPEGSIDPDERVLTLGKANYARQGEEIRFRWHDFALVRDSDLPDDMRAEIAATIQASHDNDVFLRCLDIRNDQERAVSENAASAKTYAPRVFADMPESKGVGIKRLEAAMDRLFRVGSIERGFLWREDRKDKFGLRRPRADRAEGCADPRADPAPTRCADPAFTPRQPRAHTHPISKDIEGAAHEAAAPSPEMDDGLDANGDIIGWNDKPHGGNL